MRSDCGAMAFIAAGYLVWMNASRTNALLKHSMTSLQRVRSSCKNNNFEKRPLTRELFFKRGARVARSSPVTPQHSNYDDADDDTVPPFVMDVTRWLAAEKVDFSKHFYPWNPSSSFSFVSPQCLGNDHEPQHTLYVLKLQPPQTIPMNSTSSTDAESDWILLHLLPSPTSLERCLPARLTQSLTDRTFGRSRDGKDSLGDLATHATAMIHWHEDVWKNTYTGPIARSRLLCRLGRVKSRVYARKTIARRIDGPTATAFLESNHLWGATKTKYSYGLFLPTSSSAGSLSPVSAKADCCDDETLVAVATFSSRRIVQRGAFQLPASTATASATTTSTTTAPSESGATLTRPHRSHELIRFCSRCDGVVVGGISKLLAAFVRDVHPDDIITVLDRDWGSTGGQNGWRTQLGFATVAVMPPVPMVVGIRDGVRRHLVGAGIQAEHNNSLLPTNHDTMTHVATSVSPLFTTATRRQDRVGLSDVVLKELAGVTSYTDALDCLFRHGFLPVHDAGVERLFLVLPTDPNSTAGQTATSTTTTVTAMDLWKSSQPTYTSQYYSDNAGVEFLLRNAECDKSSSSRGEGTNS